MCVNVLCDAFLDKELFPVSNLLMRLVRKLYNLFDQNICLGLDPNC